MKASQERRKQAKQRGDPPVQAKRLDHWNMMENVMKTRYSLPESHPSHLSSTAVASSLQNDLVRTRELHSHIKPTQDSKQFQNDVRHNIEAQQQARQAIAGLNAITDNGLASQHLTTQSVSPVQHQKIGQMAGAMNAHVPDLITSAQAEQRVSTESRANQYKAAERGLKESQTVLGTLGMLGDVDIGNVSVTMKGNRVEGIMTTNSPVSHAEPLGIGFLTTNPKNILPGPHRQGGVGTSLISHAETLARQQQRPAVTLGAEGKDAQGFYRSRGFTKPDGEVLQDHEMRTHSVDMMKKV